MNKKELVRTVAKKTKISQKSVNHVINAMVETVADELEKKEKVQITGFGTLETRRREARKGKNPRTGEEIDIAATTIVAFRSGKMLKERVSR